MTSEPRQGEGHRGSRAEGKGNGGVCYLACGAVGARATGEAKAGPKGAGYLKCGKEKKKKKFSGGVILDFAQPTFLPPTPPGLDKNLHMTDFMGSAKGLVPPAGHAGLCPGPAPLGSRSLHRLPVPGKRGSHRSQVPRDLLPRGKRQNMNFLPSLLLSSIGQRARSCMAA